MATKFLAAKINFCLLVFLFKIKIAAHKQEKSIQVNRFASEENKTCLLQVSNSVEQVPLVQQISRETVFRTKGMVQFGQC